jgi:hypothetical protein
MNKDNNLISFKAIVNFIEALSELYSEKQRSLLLYNHLIGKTQIKHEFAINKHINLFKEFCIANREGIIAKDFNKFEVLEIKYSDKVFIDFREIFEFTKKDKVNRDPIKKHLLYISALVDPTAKAKDILKKKKGTENDFLKNVIDSIEKNVDKDSNPMEAMGSILQSGVFTDMMSSMSEGLESGNLDLSKLMGSVQGMVSGLNESMSSGVDPGDGKVSDADESTEIPTRSGPPPELMNGMSEMLNSLTSSMNSGDGEAPSLDLSKMLGPLLNGLSGAGGGDGSSPNMGIPGGMGNMMNLVSSLSSPNVSIEEQLNAEYSKSKGEE